MSRLDPFFDPRGIIVAGASAHPGKFGFVTLHNILRCGYRGRVFPVSLEGGELLGLPVARSVDELPDGAADLVFVCTPPAANPEVLRACARKGVRAAFVATAGYGEAGAAGLAAQAELVAVADELGILLAGPNGQGIVSTPSSLCAQIVAPYPPSGRIGIVSQSGNFVSSLLNLSRQSEVGVSRAVSAGNAASITVADYLGYLADDDATAVSLAYVESVGDGRAFYEQARRTTAGQPLVVLQGGTTVGGRRAAASHTGSLASDARVFAGMCRQAGISQASTLEEAFEAAATFATQPLPTGPAVVVVTTVGGWGVATADAIGRSELVLAPLPDDLRTAIDGILPPRWSRNNPIDLAGSETRDTVPAVLDLVARHAGVDAVIFLGIGIQSNQARMMRTGEFAADHGLERVVEFHERQDAALRGSRSRGVGRNRQADPRRHRARGHRSRQPRSAQRARDRSVLRAVGDARGHRTRTPVALRAVPRASGRRVSATARRVRSRPHSSSPRCWPCSWRSRARTRSAGTSSVAAATTPLWSVRRVPEPVADAVGEQHLQTALDAAAPGAGTCFVVSAGGRTIAAHNTDTPLIGASTQKLLTAAAALATLGPDFAFQTRVVAPEAPADGSVDRLWLVGSGDPVLSTGDYAGFLQANGETRGSVTTSLESLADSIVAKGVRDVPGGIVGDDVPLRWSAVPHRPLEVDLSHRRRDQPLRARSPSTAGSPPGPPVGGSRPMMLPDTPRRS